MYVENPLVSVIIPTYNAYATIGRCLDSLRIQSYSHVEVIVVDNFSLDGTSATAKAFGAKVIQQKSSPAAARNTGINNSNGEYVFFIDSDQVLSGQIIQECVAKCESENAVMVRIPEVFVGKGFWGCSSAEWKNYYEKVERKFERRAEIFSGDPRFFAKKLLLDVGLYNVSLLWGEDYDLYQRLKETKAKEVACESKLYHYEPSSVKGIVTKNMRYGESMGSFMYHSRKPVFLRVMRHSMLTWQEILFDLRSKPAITLGCTLLLGMKAFAMTAGLLGDL